jgi:hypothetical protein
MQARVGHGGWCRIDKDPENENDPDLPGPMYVRLSNVGGNVVITEMYIDGRGERVKPGVLRKLNTSEIEQWLSSAYPRKQLGVPGPDLSRLAETYSTTWGPAMYAGAHCENCDGPVMGHHGPDGRPRAVTDWLALSWLAQIPETGIKQPRRRARSHDRAAIPHSEMPRLEEPTRRRIPDEWLLTLRSAYEWCVANGKSPAKTIAAHLGMDDEAGQRKVQNWIALARKRGLMPRPPRPGRPA